MIYKSFGKRILDFTLSFLGLFIVLPLFLIVMILLFFSNQGKPFFFQLRPGKDEKIFKIIKFKTMNDKKDESGKLLPSDERITVIGNFIRRTSLDEIPQLINVIKGDMSLIGPRPLLIKYLSVYNKEQSRRHSIKPGITGHAQVKGRNTLSWEQKFEYDVWYVDNLTFMLDVKIILLTIKKIFNSDGIYGTNDSIVPDFIGTKKTKND